MTSKWGASYYSRPRLLFPLARHHVFDTTTHLANKRFMGHVHAFVGVLRGAELDPKSRKYRFNIEYLTLVNFDDSLAEPMEHDINVIIWGKEDAGKAHAAISRSLRDGDPRCIWFEARGWPKSVGNVRHVAISRRTGDAGYDRAYLTRPPWLARLADPTGYLPSQHSHGDRPRTYGPQTTYKVNRLHPGDDGYETAEGI